MQWRNKPLFRSSGDVKFKTGSEAADLLNAFVSLAFPLLPDTIVRSRGGGPQAQKRDSNQVLFLQTFQSCITALAPLFDRNPKFAWIAKQLVEPERLIQFRVAWLDDTGILRVNRGYRVQYSSSLGPYDGGLHFGKHVSTDFVKAAAFDALCSNALAGKGPAQLKNDAVVVEDCFPTSLSTFFKNVGVAAATSTSISLNEHHPVSLSFFW
jgi:glutamate dehydrogenase (NADP+)